MILLAHAKKQFDDWLEARRHAGSDPIYQEPNISPEVTRLTEVLASLSDQVCAVLADAGLNGTFELLGRQHRLFSKRDMYLHVELSSAVGDVLTEGVAFYRSIAVAPRRSPTESSPMHDKEKRLDDKDARRLRLLDAVYELTDGEAGEYTSYPEAYERAGLDEDDGGAAAHFLANEGLLLRTAGHVGLTPRGVTERERAIRNQGARTEHFSAAAVQNVFNIHAPVNVLQTGHSSVAKKLTQDIGAVATGNRAQAHGSVSQARPLSQREYVEIVNTAQAALVKDQDTLDRIDAGLYDGFHQVLRLLRDVQLSHDDLARQVEQVTSAVDEIWASQAAARLRSHKFPEIGLHFLQALATHVVTGAVIERIKG